MSDWAGVSASVRGSSHVRGDVVNQDAVGVRRSDAGLVAAVADGHGGRRYVRSDRGSRAAVDLALELGDELLVESSRRGATALDEAAMAGLFRRLLDRWRSVVAADAAASPFTDDERRRAGDPLDDEVQVAYGSTLLIALVNTEHVALAQLGDGDVLAVSPDGAAAQPLPTDPRLVGGQTTSLCLVSALDDVRFAVLPATSVELLALCTDGYGNSFAADEWRDDVSADLLIDVRRRGLGPIGEDLPEWLAESAEAGGDDVSIAVLHHDITPMDRTRGVGPRP